MYLQTARHNLGREENLPTLDTDNVAVHFPVPRLTYSPPSSLATAPSVRPARQRTRLPYAERGKVFQYFMSRGSVGRKGREGKGGKREGRRSLGKAKKLANIVYRIEHQWQ